MKTNAILFYVLAGVFFVAAAVYTGWTWFDQASSQIAGSSELDGTYSGQPEWVGTVAMTLSAVLALFIAVWLVPRQPFDRRNATRRHRDERTTR